MLTVIVILLFAANLMLAVIAWSIGQVNHTLLNESLDRKKQHAETYIVLRNSKLTQVDLKDLVAKLVKNKGL